MLDTHDPTPLNDALRQLHRSALVSLALCGIGIGLMAYNGGPGGPFDAGASRWPALLLAALAIGLRRPRRLARRGLRPYLYGTVASLLAAVGLGVLGIVMASQAQPAVGCLYALGGALLLFQPPARLVLPKRPEAD